MKNLGKRKTLASKVLKVGEGRICFDVERLEEIKEAITKQDIRDFYEQGIITIKPKKGRRRKEQRKTRRGPGKIKNKLKPGKKQYVNLIRKLRKIIKELRRTGKIDKNVYEDLRKKIKARTFRDKSHLKEYLGGLK